MSSIEPRQCACNRLVYSYLQNYLDSPIVDSHDDDSDTESHMKPVKFPLTPALSDNSPFRLGNEKNSGDTDDEELVVRVRRDKSARKKVLCIL